MPSTPEVRSSLLPVESLALSSDVVQVVVDDEIDDVSSHILHLVSSTSPSAKSEDSRALTSLGAEDNCDTSIESEIEASESTWVISTVASEDASAPEPSSAFTSSTPEQVSSSLHPASSVDLFLSSSNDISQDASVVENAPSKPSTPPSDGFNDDSKLEVSGMTPTTLTSVDALVSDLSSTPSTPVPSCPASLVEPLLSPSNGATQAVSIVDDEVDDALSQIPHSALSASTSSSDEANDASETSTLIGTENDSNISAEPKIEVSLLSTVAPEDTSVPELLHVILISPSNSQEVSSGLLPESPAEPLLSLSSNVSQDVSGVDGQVDDLLSEIPHSGLSNSVTMEADDDSATQANKNSAVSASDAMYKEWQVLRANMLEPHSQYNDDPPATHKTSGMSTSEAAEATNKSKTSSRDRVEADDDSHTLACPLTQADENVETEVVEADDDSEVFIYPGFEPDKEVETSTSEIVEADDDSEVFIYPGSELDREVETSNSKAVELAAELEMSNDDSKTSKQTMDIQRANESLACDVPPTTSEVLASLSSPLLLLGDHEHNLAHNKVHPLSYILHHLLTRLPSLG